MKTGIKTIGLGILAAGFIIYGVNRINSKDDLKETASNEPSVVIKEPKAKSSSSSSSSSSKPEEAAKAPDEVAPQPHDNVPVTQTSGGVVLDGQFISNGTLDYMRGQLDANGFVGGAASVGDLARLYLDARNNNMNVVPWAEQSGYPRY